MSHPPINIITVRTYQHGEVTAVEHYVAYIMRLHS